MLLLTRRVGQSIAIEGGRIRLMVTYIGRDEVQIGVEADRSIPVHRAEVQARIEREKKETACEPMCPTPATPKTATVLLPSGWSLQELPRRQPGD